MAVDKASGAVQPKGAWTRFVEFFNTLFGFVFVFAVAFVLFVIWGAFLFESRSALGSNSGRSLYYMLPAAAIIGFLLIVPGLLIVTRKGTSTRKVTAVLILIVVALVGSYATYYFYLGVDKNFSTPVGRGTAVEMALGYLTNTDVARVTAQSQAAKVMVLSQGVVDWVFIIAIVALALSRITDRMKGE